MTKEEYMQNYKNLTYLCFRDGDDVVYGRASEAYFVLVNVFNVSPRELTKIEREAWKEYEKDGKPAAI